MSMDCEPNIYLDHNATTPLDKTVLADMLPYMTDHFGNPSSVHAHGQKARGAQDLARMEVAQLIGAEPEEITFTSGGTEANNLALSGHLDTITSAKPTVITSPLEHHAVHNPLFYLQEKGAIELHQCRVHGDGTVDLDYLKTLMAIHPPDLLSVMLANNDTGVVQPVKEAAAMAHQYGAKCHCDAVQAAGKMAINVADLGVDMLTISAHKFYGPRGIGALYVRRGTRLHPTLLGGSQEARRRAGTENTAAIVGFGRACSLAIERLTTDRDHLLTLRAAFEEIVSSSSGVTIFGQQASRIPSTSYVGLDGVEGETMVMVMDLNGFSISNGSACNSESRDPSHVLLAMGVAPKNARSAVRCSFGRQNDINQVTWAAKTLINHYNRLKSQ